ncbi:MULTISPECIES: DUF3800 domain-containing protein [Pseudomonas]|uniref:DUF3800 domain-containing protein n=1 Tax=Pseudomonas TaxID=286 RepID=UPI000F76F947|nr:DUF3800 domain-containing protein [Pseudomonas sp. o96-267]RRV30430.1 DUF3800 domain-containing protein [Pseudomonas sp. o96-267]
MLTEKHYAYVDESGNTSLNIEKDGTSEYYVVCAIISSEHNLKQNEKVAEAIRERHFKTSEIKSSNVGHKSHNRRIQILEDLAKLEIRLEIIAINKSEIYPDSGLKHKKSFIKYGTSILYKNLYETYPTIEVLADEHGSPEFKSSLEAYVNRKFDLIDSTSAFGTAKSHEAILIQVADFYAGTIAHIYEEKCPPYIALEYLNKIREKQNSFIEWPIRYTSPPQSKSSTPQDQKVYEIAIKSAYDYLSKTPKSADQSKRLQTAILKFLLFKNTLEGTSNYISTVEIENHLKNIGLTDITQQMLRTGGIAKLRDESVIIASSPNGYKIPTSLSDIQDYLNKVTSQIIPILDRVKKMHNHYRTQSAGTLEMINKDSAGDLCNLIEASDPAWQKIQAQLIKDNN